MNNFWSKGVRFLTVVLYVGVDFVAVILVVDDVAGSCRRVFSVEGGLGQGRSVFVNRKKLLLLL